MTHVHPGEGVVGGSAPDHTVRKGPDLGCSEAGPGLAAADRGAGHDAGGPAGSWAGVPQGGTGGHEPGNHPHPAPKQQPPPPGAAALVHGDPVPVARVEALLQATPPRDPEAHREGRARAARQHRRWATQVVIADELARRACADLGLRPPEEPPPATLDVDEADAAELGSIIAALFAFSPAARTLLRHLEEAQHLPESAVRDYYDRNPDRFRTPEALRRGADPYAQPALGDLVPYRDARPGIEAELRSALGRRAFFTWLDRERAAVVHAAGHEHPGDPGHSDHEHRH